VTNVEGRVIQLELAVNALQQQIAALLTRMAAAEQLGRSSQGITYNWGGGGGATASYWCMSPAGGLAASSGTFPDIASVPASLTVYQSVGGVYAAVGTRICYWWYRDALPQYRLVPLVANGDGSYDMLANGCTPVNP